jgi:membrane-associated phospholipid phosphatase
MINYLQTIDLKLLYLINHSFSNSVFDLVMPVLRNKLTWLPLYAVVVYLIIKKYSLKSIWVIAFAILSVVIADQVSSGLMKPFFERVRPCNNPNLTSWLNLPMGKGNGWSFVSSHAANHFALAVYFSLVLIGYKNQFKIIFPFLCWASLIAFAQVYIGFHYPSDVIVGGLLGAFIGWGMGKLNCLVMCMRSGKKL